MNALFAGGGGITKKETSIKGVPATEIKVTKVQFRIKHRKHGLIGKRGTRGGPGRGKMRNSFT